MVLGREVGALQVAINCVKEFGGSAKAALDFQRALGGYTLSFTSREYMSFISNSKAIHLPTGNNPISRHYSIPKLGAINRWIRKNDSRPGLVVIHGLYRYHAQWASRWARKQGIPYWVVLNGALDPWVFTYRTFQKRLWMKAVGQRILNEAACVIAATRREAEKAAPFLRDCRVSVVHLPVSKIDTSDRQAIRMEVRKSLGIPSQARILLFLGRLHPMKRIGEMIESVHFAGVPDVHLVVVGTSSEELSIESCKEQVRLLGARNIHMVGPAFGADKNRWLLGSDGFVSLSFRENFNYAAADAMIAGLPVILSPGNDLCLELDSIGAGWTLNSFERDEEIDAIQQFSRSSVNDLATMGAAGTQWAISNLSEEKFESCTQKLWQQ